MDKPFRTHDELICIMNARGLKADNRTKFILEREGYYAVVNGHKDLFIDSDAKQSAKGEDRYKDGTYSDSVFAKNGSWHVKARWQRNWHL